MCSCFTVACDSEWVWYRHNKESVRRSVFVLIACVHLCVLFPCSCVYISVYESRCACNVSHAPSLCAYDIEVTAGTFEIFSFSAFISLWKQFWYNCQQIFVTTGYSVTMNTRLCIVNLSSLHGTLFSMLFSANHKAYFIVNIVCYKPNKCNKLC